MDPIERLFGTPALALFRAGQLTVEHGPIERLPDWMSSGPLGSIDALAAGYRGRLHAAHGGDGRERHTVDDYIGEGGQTPIQGANARALLRLGLTVFFQDLAEFLPSARAFEQSLDAALGVPARSTSVSAFVNAPGSGLPLHHDSHDQLLIHLIGEKVLEVGLGTHARHPNLMYSPRVTPPPHFATVYRDGFLGSDEDIEGAGLGAIELHPGSCVFLPAGVWHRTSDQREACLSLTIAVRPPSRLDLLTNALAFSAGQSPFWRAPTYGFFSSDAGAFGATDRERLAESLRSFTDAELRAAWLASRVEDGAVERYPTGLTVAHYVRLPGTRVRFFDESSGRVRCGLAVVAGTQETVLEFDENARGIILHLLSLRRVFSMDEVAAAHPVFEREELADFLRQLAAAGLLRPVPSRAWADDH